MKSGLPSLSGKISSRKKCQLANDADSMAARAVDRDDRFEGYLPGVGEEDDAWLDRSSRRPSSRRRVGDRGREDSLGDRDQMLDEAVADLADVGFGVG